jgi:hypothetical protein
VIDLKSHILGGGEMMSENCLLKRGFTIMGWSEDRLVILRKAGISFFPHYSMLTTINKTLLHGVSTSFNSEFCFNKVGCCFQEVFAQYHTMVRISD